MVCVMAISVMVYVMVMLCNGVCDGDICDGVCDGDAV